MISEKDKIDFYNILYFSNDYSDFKQKAIWRAYRDFSRTLRFEQFKKDSTIIIVVKNDWERIVLDIIQEVCNKKFATQEEFDNWHKEKTISLENNQSNNLKLTIGQAQKWINMTLKYLFLFGEEIVPGITNNSIFFHIPIDNIIQERILDVFNINKIKCSWSRINSYQDYLDYQKKFKEKVLTYSTQNSISISPFEFEFKLFNNKNFNQ